jgi:hypothetical protein
VSVKRYLVVDSSGARSEVATFDTYTEACCYFAAAYGVGQTGVQIYTSVDHYAEQRARTAPMIKCGGFTPPTGPADPGKVSWTRERFHMNIDLPDAEDRGCDGTDGIRGCILAKDHSGVCALVDDELDESEVAEALSEKTRLDYETHLNRAR